jgi:hypothetical protein
MIFFAAVSNRMSFEPFGGQESHPYLLIDRTRLTLADRLFWSWLSRCWSPWRSAIVLVQPDTVVRWHRLSWRLTPGTGPFGTGPTRHGGLKLNVKKTTMKMAERGGVQAPGDVSVPELSRCMASADGRST